MLVALGAAFVWIGGLIIAWAMGKSYGEDSLVEKLAHMSTEELTKWHDRLVMLRAFPND